MGRTLVAYSLLASASQWFGLALSLTSMSYNTQIYAIYTRFCHATNAF